MFTQPFHDFDTHNALLSEGEVFAVVVWDFPEMPHQARDNRDFPRPLRESEARLRLTGPPSPGATARRTRGVLVVRATPPFSALVRHRGGLAVSPHSSRLTSPWRVAPTTVIPFGKARIEAARIAKRAQWIPRHPTERFASRHAAAVIRLLVLTG